MDTKLNGKEFFEKCCLECGIDCKAHFQLGHSTQLAKGRFSHTFSELTRVESMDYAVCYMNQYNLYIAWSLREPKASRKRTFSLKQTDFVFKSPEQILLFRKSIEYSGWNEEDVYIFQPEGVKKFIVSMLEV